MNWLAHVLLSENHIESQLGNLLTDPLKAKAWDGASQRIYDGISMHLFIDSFTDTHPLVSQSKAILTARGHLKGVVLDILYDYFLSQHWKKFCLIEKSIFLDTFRFQSIEQIEYYPSKAKSIISRVVMHKQLESYAHMDGVVNAFKRIDTRLSSRAKSKDTCERYIPLVAKNIELLESNFLIFFPELMHVVKNKYMHIDLKHWKI